MFRFLLWRMLAVAAGLVGLLALAWLLQGGIGRSLRAGRGLNAGGPLSALASAARAGLLLLTPGLLILGLAAALAALLLIISIAARTTARRRRHYVRLRMSLYRLDTAEPEAITRAFAALHAALSVRWWRRLTQGQPSLSVEVHHRPGPQGEASRSWLAASCPAGCRRAVEAALRTAYPNLRLEPRAEPIGLAPALLRLKKHATFIARTATPERAGRPPEPPMNHLLTAMGALGAPAYLQIALTPAPALYERLARSMYRHREARISRRRRERLITLDRSMLLDAELRGGLEVQHRGLFFADIRIVAPRRRDCEHLAAPLRTGRAENRLVERGAAIRHGVLGTYARRLQRGEGNPLPGLLRGVLSPGELAELWQAPSVDYSLVPFSRAPVPLAPAPPEVHRPARGPGILTDALGPVSIHPELRRQNVAVPGTVEQGKSSLLVASVAEDLLRERCAVIVLDPKGDAAEAALSAVPPERDCMLVDFAHPTCGFNPLAVQAPADVIADYVVAALKQLFSESDIRASSDRYLRNAIIAVLSYDPAGTLWDAARLLSVGEEGYAYRRKVAAGVRALPELKEISQFFTEELSAQLADARSATTAKLDAPVNKLARLLNSPSIKRLLLNRSLLLDFDRVIARGEVVIVKGALGAMGAGNTSVLMQLLVGMLDAALARQQDRAPAGARSSVALKIDEAPLVLNSGFAQTMALKRSAGLETLACWQTDSQWVDRDVRDQLDALFAHRIYFATASARDARAAVALTAAEFSDSIRPDTIRLSALGRPDVRLRLPRHHAVVSLTTPQGRQQAFVAQTLPMRVDPERLAHHAAAQRRRGGLYLDTLDQPHWDRDANGGDESRQDPPAQPPAHTPADPPPEPARPPTGACAGSYRELAELDAVQSLRLVPAGAMRGLDPQRHDLDTLELIAELGPVLSSQIHRRLAPARAISTTQRRLKRLADARLVERFQLHRGDGGGAPMCYLIAACGLELLERHGRAAGGASSERPGGPLPAASEQPALLRQCRHHLRAAGWALALAEQAQQAVVRGPLSSVLPAPRLRDGRPFSPSHLSLPAGRVPHDLLRTLRSGQRVEADRFQTLRPDMSVLIEPAPGRRALDVLVELDDRHRSEGWVAKLERYEHFLVGWSLTLPRYGPDAPAEAIAVFVCRDAQHARQCARRADSLLLGCRAYAGQSPLAWEYAARRQILFAAERDIHEGSPRAWGLPALPPALRVQQADGDPLAAESAVQVREIPARAS